jgi:hypothetical protein
MNDYDKVIEKNPRHRMAYHARAVLKFNTGDKKGSCADWGKAIALGDINAKGFYTIYF